jgi:hypothetical protein
MKCVILQPSYIPWRGYFHQIAKADVFIFYDDVQYDKRGWRNRNQIKSPHGPLWLTIPVHSKGAQIEHIPINKIEISWDRSWNRDHWRTIQSAYARTPYFKEYVPLLETIYQREDALLVDFTIESTIVLARALGIQHTRFLRSSDLDVSGSKTDRLIAILAKVKANSYLSGPSAQAYIEPNKFSQAGIQLEYMTYDYPEYPQLYPPFEAQISILDLLFMTGPDALDYILSPGEILPSGAQDGI